MKRKDNKKSIIISSERATVNPRLPKYYAGCNVDTLMEKWYQGKTLTREEKEVFLGVVDTYYEPEFQKDCNKEFIRLLKIHDKGIYPTASIVGTPFWKSVFPGDDKQNKSDLLSYSKEEVTEEMSKLNPQLPRYYDGYDLDVLLEKRSHQPLPKNEEVIINRAAREYRQKEFARRDKAWEKKEQERIEKYRNTNNPFVKTITRIDLTLTMPEINFYVRDFDE